MAAMLLGGDDSSSGESDNEDVSRVTTGASAVAAAVQPNISPTPPAAAAANAAATATNNGPPASKSELSQRLKSLYSPANQVPKNSSSVSPPPQLQQQQLPPHHQRVSGSTSSGRPPSQHSAGQPHPGQSQQQMQQQQQHQSNSRGIPPPSQQQHQQHQQQQQRSSGGGGGITHQISHQPTQSGYPASRGHPSGQSQQQQQRSYSSQQQPPPPQQPQQYRQQQQQQQQQSQYQRSNSGGGGVSHPQALSRSGVPNPVPPQQQLQRRTGSGGGAGGGGGSNYDAFDPTPLHKINEREQRAPQVTAQQRYSGGGGGGGGANSSASTVVASNITTTTGGSGSGTANNNSVGRPMVDPVDREKEMRRQKERFLMFTRVLMKYLESKDPPLHQNVKAIIKDCADRNKRQERGYESVTASMRSRLKEVVGENYWKRAESYLAHFLAQKQKVAGQKGSSSGVSGNSSSNSDAARQQAELKRKQQQLEMERRRQQQQQKLQQQKMAQLQAQQQQGQQPPTPQPQMAPGTTTTTITKPKTVTGKGKRAAPAGKQTAGKQPKKARKASVTGTKKSTAAAAVAVVQQQQQQKQQQQQQQQQPAGPGAAVIFTADQPHRAPSPPPVREYSELMETIDHAVHFDWTTAGLIMGSSVQKQQLQQEQKNLLYNSTAVATNKTTPTGASHGGTPTMEWRRGGTTDDTALNINSQDANEEKSKDTTAFALRGWGERNLVSPRVAWARIRHNEQPSAQQKTRLKVLEPDAPPSVTEPSETAWLNETKAEKDTTLALLSEATQIYATQILQKALVCARRRQNLDGIRLWHQQCSAAVELAKSEKDDSAVSKPTPPPLSIRLGCDVSRQVARTMGNAALTSKRMEEALDRRKLEAATRVVPAIKAITLDATTVASAQSMGELSLLPPLAKASEKADYDAKVSFEIYGGKFSQEPPFGRVPEKATLEVADFQQGIELGNVLGGGRANRRFRANPHAFSFT